MNALHALGARCQAFYARMRRDTVREELRFRGQPVSGLKAELEDRLCRLDVGAQEEPRLKSQAG